jgi:DNA-binding transcriptional regulator YiaG
MPATIRSTGRFDSELNEPAQVAATRSRRPEGATMITAAQCRAARTLRSLSLAKLAAAAGISESEIDDFELERRQLDPTALEALQRTLEEAGIIFLPGGDVRLLTEGSTGHR